VLGTKVLAQRHPGCGLELVAHETLHTIIDAIALLKRIVLLANAIPHSASLQCRCGVCGM
jgi:hypothetical protein